MFGTDISQQLDWAKKEAKKVSAIPLRSSLLAHIKDLFAGRELAAQEANAKICKKLDSICDALQQLVRRGNKLAAAVVVSAGPPGDHP